MEKFQRTSAFNGQREAVTSLFRAVIKLWKARDSLASSLTSCDQQKVWDSVLVDLFGDECPLRINQYTGNLPDFCRRLYEQSSCPLVVVESKVWTMAQDTTERIVDLLLSFGYRGTFSEEWFLWTRVHYAILYMNGSWGKNLKYHVGWLFNHYEGLEQQPRSSDIVGKDGFLCAGHPGRSLKRRIQGYSLGAMEKRFTVLQGFKKSLLPLDERQWEETVRGTSVSLSKDPPPCSEESSEALRRTGRELRMRMREFIIRKNFTLSKSACVENNRSAGGFAGVFFDRMGLTSEERDPDGVVYRISPPVLVGDVRYKGRFGYKLLYSRCPYSFLDVYQDGMEEIFRPEGHYADGTVRESVLGDSPARVKVRVIPEPFKFRVISVGEYDVYSILKPFQHMMWKTLQQFETFCLTGYESDFLADHVGSTVTKWMDVGKKMLSGDYKEATNMLSSDAAKILCNEWFRDYPEFLWILERSLFRSRLEFDMAGKGVPALVPGAQLSLEGLDCEMSNGQLMGHPCSFPILCAVNAAMCRLALEKDWKRSFSLDDLPLLINGDDCLLIGSNDLQGFWREITQEAGLIESVGKSYFSDQFGMINSRYLRVLSAPSEDVGPFELPSRYISYVANDVGYVNLGILQGRKKGSNVDCEVNVRDEVNDETAFKFWQSAAANYEQMNLRCKKTIIPREWYISNFRRFFDTIPLPLDAPKEQGGFGFSSRDSLLFPKKFLRMTQNGSVKLGEAYFSGGMATCKDDDSCPDFLEEARMWGRRHRGKYFPRESIATCPLEERQEERVVTVL